MTHLQSVRAQIRGLEERLSGLRRNKADAGRIAQLTIADPKMQLHMRERIPILDHEIEDTIHAILAAQTKEHRLTWRR